MPPTYGLRIAPAAQRQLERLTPPIQFRVRSAIRALAQNPRPAGVALISGKGTVRVWRIRLGDYRVLYEIHDDLLVVLVIGVGHRREIYRGPQISESGGAYEAMTDRRQPHGGRSWAREVLYPLQTR